MTGPIELLLRSVQRRLWVEALCARERRAAWASAAAVVGGAVWHLGLGAHSGHWTAAAALALLAVPLAAGVVAGWPSAAEAARRADAWFDGKELMTSAEDQLARAPAERAPAADFVVARAAERAVVWRERLATRRPGLGLRRLSAPLAVALVGAFLHLLPGRAPSAALRGTSAALPVDGAKRAAGPAGPEGGVLAWSRPVASGTAPTARAASPATAPGAIGAPGREGAESTAAAPGSGGGPGTGRLPGEAAPREGLLHPGTDEPLGTSFVDLPRPAGGTAAGSRAIELAGQLAGDVSRVASRAPAAAPPPDVAALEARSDLPPMLRAYVAAYLHRLGGDR